MDKTYQDFDMIGAKRGLPPQIARLQAQNKTKAEIDERLLIEPDVWQLILKKADNATEIARVNQVLRAMLA